MPAAIVTSVVVLATGAVVRSRRSSSHETPHETPARAPHAVSVTSAAIGDASVAPPSLRGSLPHEPARVVDHAARMIHGDAHHTHRAHGRGPSQVKLAWSTQVGGAIEAQVTTSPDEQTLYVASLDGTLTALGRDGAKRWSVSLGDRVYSTPCVAGDGTIYVGSDAKRFYAIAPDGRIVWKLEVDGDADTGAVIAKDGSIVFAAGRSVYAVRAGGDIAWRFTAKSKVFTAPAIGDDGTVFFGAQDHRVYALSRGGVLAWSIDLGADVDGAPAIGDDGALYVGTDGDEIVRIAKPAQSADLPMNTTDPSDAGDGGYARDAGDAGDAGLASGAWEIAWRTNVGGYVRGTLAIARNGDVVAGVYGPLPRVVRLAARDGAIASAFSVQGTGAREFGVHGGALEDDIGTLYFGAQDDDVYGVNIEGNVVLRFTTGGDVDAPLTLLGTGELVVASDDGKVYLFAP